MELTITEEAEAGIFYAIGVGPGASDLITLRGAGVLHTCDWVIAPRSKETSESLALTTVRPFLTPRQRIHEHIYPMKRDHEETLASWRRIADFVVEKTEAGGSVAQITIGDPLIYSTTHYLLEGVAGRITAENIRIIPGISAFQGAASNFCETLTIQEDRMTLMTATDLKAVNEALNHCETLVLYKAGRLLDRLDELLEKRGGVEKALVASYVEQEGKARLSPDIKEAASKYRGYMSTVIIRTGRRSWQEKE